jgi:hypothetical protein
MIARAGLEIRRWMTRPPAESGEPYHNQFEAWAPRGAVRVAQAPLPTVVRARWLREMAIHPEVLRLFDGLDDEEFRTWIAVETAAAAFNDTLSSVQT